MRSALVPMIASENSAVSSPVWIQRFAANVDSCDGCFGLPSSIRPAPEKGDVGSKGSFTGANSQDAAVSQP